MAEQVGPFEIGIEPDLIPELNGRYSTEARITVQCFNATVIGDATILVNKRTEKFSDTVSSREDNAHCVEYENVHRVLPIVSNRGNGVDRQAVKAREPGF